MPAPSQPEFSRPLSPAGLAALGDTPATGAADAAECAALALRFAVPAVRSLRYSLMATPYGTGGWRLEGHAEAVLEQQCVVTLEPMETTVHEAVDRRFVPADRLSGLDQGGDGDFDAAMASGPDGFDGVIDLGEVAAEAIALGIDPYPRREGASVGSVLKGPEGSAPLTDEAARPFAALSALKSRRSDA